MKRTKALLRGEGEVGLLMTGEDPQEMSDDDLMGFIQSAGIDDIADDFVSEEIEVRP